MLSQSTTSMQLNELLRPFVTNVDLPALTATGMALDSRKVRAGDAYIALRGTQVHGLSFAQTAIENGAIAILLDEADEHCEQSRNLSVPIIAIPQLTKQLGGIASAFYQHPSQRLCVCGVTGTDGKTSVCRFVADALTQLGHKVGYVGTIGWGLGSQLEPNPLTTPDALTLQAMMNTFYHKGAEFIILEVSSHALVQGRVNGVAFDVAVLTNFGRDHLDYHGNLEAYRDAKARLFDWPNLSAVVVNVDDEFGQSIAAQCAGRVPVSGFTSKDKKSAIKVELDHTVAATDITVNENGIAFTMVGDDCRRTIESKLLGRFNVDNLLSCFAILRTFGISSDQATKYLTRIKPVPGRMERFGGQSLANFVVDFAHTPQALQAALQTLRVHCLGRLWVVFGCGGDRDPGKRKLMGQVAACHADAIVLTDDNPRSEPSKIIIEQILEGIPDADSATVIADRGSALRHVVSEAAKDDWVLVAGKGHEDYQIVGSRRLKFSDRDTLLQLIQNQQSDNEHGGRT